MSCNPEAVTGYVDRSLEPALRYEVESHLAQCEACRAQALEEEALRRALRALPEVPAPSHLEFKVRRSLKPPSRLRLLLPLAAAVVLAAWWTRGLPVLVASELSRDHSHCFGFEHLPTQIDTSDPEELAAWYAQHGTELPAIPAQTRGLQLVGGRFCPLVDRKVAHVYYSDGGGKHLSLYVVPGPARIGGGYLRDVRGKTVKLLHLDSHTIGLVSENAEVVRTFERALGNRHVELPVDGVPEV